MKRCFILPTFGKVEDCSLHYFSDACKKGYGHIAYLYVVDESGKGHCSLIYQEWNLLLQHYQQKFL